MKTYIPESILVSLAKSVLKLWEQHTDGMSHYDGPHLWKAYAFEAIHAGTWTAFENFVDSLAKFSDENASWTTSEVTFRSVAMDAIRRTRTFWSENI